MNKRAGAMWDLVDKRLSKWYDVCVLDLGFGHGDMMKFALQKGATVFGVDVDQELTQEMADWLAERSLDLAGLGQVLSIDIDDFITGFSSRRDIPPMLPPPDVVFFFSVAPYLPDPGKVLRWIVEESGAEHAFMEFQYKGDGPAGGWLSDQQPAGLAECAEWIQNEMAPISQYLINIGSTVVPGREPGFRNIWHWKRVSTPE